MYEGRQTLPSAITGVCGRIVGGKADSDFERLALGDGRRLAWVTGPAGLRQLVGRSGAEAVLGIGKKQGWLQEKLADGMRWKLVVMPQADCVRADWNGVFTLTRRHYPEVAPKIDRWRAAMEDRALAGSIDPEMVTTAVKDSGTHPAHLTVERYLACEDTAANARLFLWHSLALNDDFAGDGWTRSPVDGSRVEEYLTTNVPLAAIPCHRLIDLDVRATG